MGDADRLTTVGLSDSGSLRGMMGSEASKRGVRFHMAIDMI